MSSFTTIYRRSSAYSKVGVVSIQGECQRVCPLRKASDLSIGSNHACFHQFSEVLESLGFSRSSLVHSLFVRTIWEERIVMLVYVDDLVLARDDSESMTDVKKLLTERFVIKELGPLSFVS